MLTIFGIKNCDSVKKARKWLESNNIDYRFHDFRADGLDKQRLSQWNKTLGWEVLLNRRGTSWRQLSQQTKDSIDEKSAMELMLENPTLIKRPVLEVDDGSMQVGFSESAYKQALL